MAYPIDASHSLFDGQQLATYRAKRTERKHISCFQFYKKRLIILINSYKNKHEIGGYGKPFLKPS